MLSSRLVELHLSQYHRQRGSFPSLFHKAAKCPTSRFLGICDYPKTMQKGRWLLFLCRDYGVGVETMITHDGFVWLHLLPILSTTCIFISSIPSSSSTAGHLHIRHELLGVGVSSRTLYCFVCSRAATDMASVISLLIDYVLSDDSRKLDYITFG